MSTRAEFREGEAAVLEAEIAEQCGILNVATGRLVSLIGQVLAAELARSATVTQLKRTLNRYTFDTAAQAPRTEPAGAAPEPEPVPEPRRVNFGFDDDDGSWRLCAVLPADQGALVERALGVSRQRLFGGDADHTDAPKVVSWADALVAVAEASLASEAIARPHYDRHLVMIHVNTDETGAGCRGVSAPSGSTCTISSTGRTAVRPTRRT